MITFSGNTISIDGRVVQLQHQIIDAFEQEDLVVVLFDPNAYLEKFGQFPNLVALGRDGELRWTAELPTNTSGDRYYKLASNIPLVACSIYSWECEIDPSTGRIRAREFYK